MATTSPNNSSSSIRAQMENLLRGTDETTTASPTTKALGKRKSPTSPDPTDTKKLKADLAALGPFLKRAAKQVTAKLRNGEKQRRTTVDPIIAARMDTEDDSKKDSESKAPNEEKQSSNVNPVTATTIGTSPNEEAAVQESSLLVQDKPCDTSNGTFIENRLVTTPTSAKRRHSDEEDLKDTPVATSLKQKVASIDDEDDRELQQLYQFDEDDWDAKFQQLYLFEKVHGHCYVPQKLKGYPGLNKFWVTQQRESYKNKSLPKDRKEKLESLSLVWDILKSRPDDYFEHMMKRLLAYKEEYGDCNVPAFGWSKDAKLVEWVHCELRLQNYRGTLSLSKEQIDSLDAIGFLWEGVCPCSSCNGNDHEDVVTRDSMIKQQLSCNVAATFFQQDVEPNSNEMTTFAGNPTGAKPLDKKKESSPPKQFNDPASWSRVCYAPCCADSPEIIALMKTVATENHQAKLKAEAKAKAAKENLEVALEKNSVSQLRQAQPFGFSAIRQNSQTGPGLSPQPLSFASSARSMPTVSFFQLLQCCEKCSDPFGRCRGTCDFAPKNGEESIGSNDTNRPVFNETYAKAESNFSFSNAEQDHPSNNACVPIDPKPSNLPLFTFEKAVSKDSRDNAAAEIHDRRAQALPAPSNNAIDENSDVKSLKAARLKAPSQPCDREVELSGKWDDTTDSHDKPLPSRTRRLDSSIRNIETKTEISNDLAEIATDISNSVDKADVKEACDCIQSPEDETAEQLKKSSIIQDFGSKVDSNLKETAHEARVPMDMKTHSTSVPTAEHSPCKETNFNGAEDTAAVASSIPATQTCVVGGISRPGNENEQVAIPLVEAPNRTNSQPFAGHSDLSSLAPSSGASVMSSKIPLVRQSSSRKFEEHLLHLEHAASCEASLGGCAQACAKFKELWNHMAGCKDNKCKVKSCCSSKKVLKHFRECKNTDCPKCMPARVELAKMGRTEGIEILAGTTSSPICKPRVDPCNLDTETSSVRSWSSVDAVMERQLEPKRIFAVESARSNSVRNMMSNASINIVSCLLGYVALDMINQFLLQTSKYETGITIKMLSLGLFHGIVGNIFYRKILRKPKSFNDYSIALKLAIAVTLWYLLLASVANLLGLKLLYSVAFSSTSIKQRLFLLCFFFESHLISLKYARSKYRLACDQIAHVGLMLFLVLLKIYFS